MYYSCTDLSGSVVSIFPTVRSEPYHVRTPAETLTCSSPYSLPDLDRSNIANAYVSGMKEELNMHGTQYNVSCQPGCSEDSMQLTHASYSK